jgi:pyruvate dehydrogenase E2 component (dihydrolipoamide acetyltransferase)
MSAPVTVPRLGWSMEEGTFVEWLKNDGDRVAPGDALFVLEGDKAAQTIEALDAGALRLGPDSPKAGDRVQVGQVIAHVAGGADAPGGATREGEAPAEPRASASRVGDAPPGRPPPGSAGASPSRSAHRQPRERKASTPRARRVARELGIDWHALAGTGHGGRVRERDVRSAAPASRGRLIPNTATRRTIAARMVAGVTQTAPVTLHTKADATNLVNLRGQFQAAGEAAPGYTDLLVKLAAAALHRHPLLQAQWRDEGLFVPDRVDIAVAVDTEAGLMAPVVRGADRLPLRELSARLRELIERARTGRLTVEDQRDATFTLTNLGAHGIDAFTPIITLPQSAVLGVGRIAREPAVVGDRVEPRDRLSLSLTFDHRVIDGAPAARFLDAVRQCVEQPAPWLVG